MLVIPDPVLGPWAKSFPTRVHGLPLSQVAGTDLRLSEFGGPVLTVHDDALRHNERTVFDWVHAQGMHLAPHGKTTMSPALWQRLLDAGAWGLTFATAWQAGVAIDAGARTVLVANAIVDRGSVRALRAALEADPALRVLVWVDALAAVGILAEGMAGSARSLEVLVELGGIGGRTGARDVDEAEAIAVAVAGAPSLRLAGAAGYEGPFGPERSAAAVASVDAYLDRLAALFDRIRPLLDDTFPAVITAGGSAWPDRVAAVLAPYAADADVVIRSGAFQIHDDGFYRRMSPFGAAVPTAPLRSAMHAWSHVVSQPEQGLALIDAGRRDVPFDIDLPVPQSVDGAVTALNDQHGFLRLADGASAAVGDVVRLGLSHPCTAFDKWRVVPVIDDPDAVDPRVVGAVATLF